MRNVLLAAILALPGNLLADVPLLTLPNALGDPPAKTAEEWTKTQRPATLELFRKHVYGRAPVGRPEKLSFKLTDTDPKAMDGAATRKLVDITYEGPGGKGTIHLALFIPNVHKGPAPGFLLICNRDPENIDPTRKVKSPFWPAEAIVARGYAAAAFYNADVDPDKFDNWKNGAHGIFDKKDAPRPPDAWGTIAAWAWGASRVLDYFESDAEVDATRIAVVGHSRGGKTALWAGARDERFAMTVSNNSGCTGAALARRKQGERVKRINTSFPHWFCDNYSVWNEREDEMPVDQHQLIALIAPRPAYVASASLDAWADPEGEFLAALHASPVYQLLGKEGLSAIKFPKPDTPLHLGHIGYHLRTGKHNLVESDWQHFMDFADKRMK